MGCFILVHLCPIHGLGHTQSLSPGPWVPSEGFTASDPAPAQSISPARGLSSKSNVMTPAWPPPPKPSMASHCPQRSSQALEDLRITKQTSPCGLVSASLPREVISPVRAGTVAAWLPRYIQGLAHYLAHEHIFVERENKGRKKCSRAALRLSSSCVVFSLYPPSRFLLAYPWQEDLCARGLFR